MPKHVNLLGRALDFFIYTCICLLRDRSEDRYEGCQRRRYVLGGHCNNNTKKNSCKNEFNMVNGTTPPLIAW